MAGWGGLGVAGRRRDLGLIVCGELDGDVGAKRGGCCSLEQTTEAVSHPSTGLCGSCEVQGRFGQASGSQRGQPDAECAVVDGRCKMALDQRPEMIDVCIQGQLGISRVAGMSVGTRTRPSWGISCGKLRRGL